MLRIIGKTLIDTNNIAAISAGLTPVIYLTTGQELITDASDVKLILHEFTLKE